MYEYHTVYAHTLAWRGSCDMTHTGWCRVIGCLVFIGHFPQKSPIIRGSFAKNDRQLEASCGSSPPCMMEWVSCHTHESAISLICMSHATKMNKPCHTYEWVMSHVGMSRVHICMRHATRMNESCHTYEWVMWHIWMSLMCDMTHSHAWNESCHTYEWVMSHVWMSHVTHMSGWCHAEEWVSCVTRLIHMCDMTHSHAWHD